jgi:hypothetical protein
VAAAMNGDVAVRNAAEFKRAVFEYCGAVDNCSFGRAGNVPQRVER